MSLSLSFSPSGIFRATTSTWNAFQQHIKLVGSTDPTTTTIIDLGQIQLGREGLDPQLNKQRITINDSHIAQLSEAVLLILNPIGNVELSIDLSCSPLQLAEAHGGIDGGSDRKIIILLVLCKTDGQVLSLIDFDGRYIVRPYETVNTQLNAVAITMSTDSTPTATGLAFLDGNTLLHRPYLLGSAYPVNIDVTAPPLNCQQPSLDPRNSTHYLLLCASSWHTVDGDGKTTPVGSREPDSVISSSRHGEVVVLSTDTQADVWTEQLTQSCSFDIDGLLIVDFMDIDGNIVVLFMTSTGVYKHDVSTGCPSSTPFLVTMVAPVCLMQQECYGYYFSEDSELLFITLRSSNPDRYKIEAYDITTNSSLGINFILSRPPLLLNYQPLPPLSPSPVPSLGTITTVSPSPSQTTPPDPNTQMKPHLIGIIAGVALLLLCCVAMTSIIVGVVIYRRCRHKRTKPDRPAERYLSEESIESLDSNPPPPIQATEDTPPVEEEHQTSVSIEKGPNQPDQFVQ